jgi:hypothetical protein
MMGLSSYSKKAISDEGRLLVFNNSNTKAPGNMKVSSHFRHDCEKKSDKKQLFVEQKEGRRVLKLTQQFFEKEGLDTEEKPGSFFAAHMGRKTMQELDISSDSLGL